MESPETGSSEQHKNEEIALKMQGVLDRVKQPQNHKALSEAGYDFANEKYDAGQGVLEKNGFWHDAVREVAVEANQAERDKKGLYPISFTESKNRMNEDAKLMSEKGEKKWEEDIILIESIVLDIDKPGIDGIDKALKYVEGALRATAQITTSEGKKIRDERRAVRDALFAEKQRRILEQQQSPQQGSSSRLSKEEIVKLNQKDKVELSELYERLGGLYSAGTPKRPPNVEKKYKVEKINTREASSQKVEKLPTDERSLFEYYKNNFKKLDDLSFEELKKKFTPETEDTYRAYVTQLLKTKIEGKPTVGRYADTVAQVLGNNPTLFQKIVVLKEGHFVDMDKVARMPFSEVAKKYLNIDLPENYFDNFSPR